MHKAAAMGAATAAPAIAVQVPGGFAEACSWQQLLVHPALGPEQRQSASRGQQRVLRHCHSVRHGLERQPRAGSTSSQKCQGRSCCLCQRGFQIPAALPQCCSHAPCSPRWFLRPGSRSWRKASGGTSLGSLNFTPLAWGWLTSSRGAGSGKKQTLPQLLGRKAQSCLWSCRGKTSPQNPAPNGRQ